MRVNILLLPNLTLGNLTDPAIVVVLEKTSSKLLTCSEIRRHTSDFFAATGFLLEKIITDETAVITIGNEAHEYPMVHEFPAQNIT